MKRILDECAVSRITQEVYYVASSDGNVIVNAKLTMQEFEKKLLDLQKSKELFYNLDKAIDEELSK